MNLINRRFVPTWYDVAPPHQNAGDGWAYDADAVKTLGPPRPPAGHMSGGTQEVSGKVRAGSYPAALFYSPDGEEMGDGMWGIIPPKAFVARLKELMAAHPHWFAPTEDERRIASAAAERPGDANAQLAAARLAWELADWKRARERIAAGLAAGPASAVEAELLYLRGRVEICEGRPDDALKTLPRTPPAGAAEAVRDGIALARARAVMLTGRWDDALAQWKRFLDERGDSPRAGEARYYSGLCHWKAGRKKKAADVWRRHRSEWPWDRMARRSAASLGLEESEAFLNQELVDEDGWW